jgi:hypothetical protein
MEDFDQLDYYALLGVERAATADEIKRAYRQQIARYHPDRFANAEPAEQEYAGRRALKINEAYRVLSDFQSRAAYTRGLSSGAARPARTPAGPVTPPPPRDHLAELYDQAQAHLAAGRKLQATAVLRELLALNPFYRDAAALLEQAEERSGAAPPPRARPAVNNRSRRALIAGGVGGLGLAALGAIGVLFRRSTPPIASNPDPTRAATSAPTEVAATTPAPTSIPPTAAPTNAPPTAAPTSIPPTPVPTVEPTIPPTSEPTATAVPASPTPEPLAESGAVLLSDNFTNAGSGWPTIDSGAWSVGYADGAYRISTQANLGNIWVYRTLPSGSDVLIGVDVTVAGGAAGMLLRFGDAGNYLAYVLDPASGAVRLDERLGGQTRNLLNVRSNAIQADSAARNRLVAVQRGTSVELRVNGQLIDTLTVNAPPVSERYGLVAVAGANPVEAQFFNLTIRAAS